MNREIKFRFWDSEYKAYLPSEKVVLNGKGKIVCIEGEKSIHTNNICTEQFTGLTDKNGVEIYEGDIVEFEINGVIEKTDVDYDYCGFYPFSTKDSYDYNSWASAYAQNKVSVIGNIHENPEMLIKQRSKQCT